MKNYSKFFSYQFVLFSILFIFNSIADPYISRPFTSVDFVAICISLIIAVVFLIVANKLYGSLDSIRLRNKIFLSIPAFLLSVLFIVLIGILFPY